MTLAANTSHPLWGNVRALICVDGGVLKCLKEPTRTFTIQPTATYGTGVYGEHIRTVQPGSFSPGGFVVDDHVPISTYDFSVSIFIAYNAIETGGDLTTNASYPSISTSSGVGYYNGITGTTNLVGSGVHSVGATRMLGDGSGAGNNKLYIDGAQEGSSTETSAATASAQIISFGGDSGFFCTTAKIVYVAVFDTLVSGSDFAALHASLTGGGNFSLVSVGGGGGGGATPRRAMLLGLG